MRAWARDGLELVGKFSDVEATVLADLMTQSIAVLSTAFDVAPDDPSRDPALERVVPDAYRDDATATATFRAATEESLIARKIGHARLVAESVHPGTVRLSPSEVQSWLRAITDLRLVIASRLGIVHDDDLGSGDEFLHDVYPWLGYLQGSMLEAMDE